MAAQNMTVLQKNQLIALMEEMHLSLYGRHFTSNGTAVKKIMWTKVTQELNSLGAKKTTKQWKECWSRIKSKVKEKHAKIRNNLIKSGAGPLSLRFTENDLKVANILKNVNVDGNEELGESGLLGKRFRMLYPHSGNFEPVRQQPTKHLPATKAFATTSSPQGREIKKQDPHSFQETTDAEVLLTIKRQNREIVQQNNEIKTLQRIISLQTKEIMALALRKN